MRKLVTLTLAVLMVGLFAAVVYAAVGAGDDSSSTVGTTETSPTTETTETTTTPENPPRHRHRHRGHRHKHRHHASPAGGVDVSGPCDEAEHANDPSCAGGQTDTPGDGQTGAQGVAEDDDVRGHDRGHDGDELEHRDGNDDQLEDHGDDRSGSGNDDLQQEDDHSGSGHDGDDGAEEHDNSGPGGGDDD